MDDTKWVKYVGAKGNPDHRPSQRKGREVDMYRYQRFRREGHKVLGKEWVS